MSTVREGNHERAWNDPPQFAYAGGTGGSRPRTQLNKRVAYTPLVAAPASSGGNVAASQPSMPPSCSAPLPIPIPPAVGNSSHASRNVHVFTPPDFHPATASPPAAGSGSPSNQTVCGSVDVSSVPNLDMLEMLSEVDAIIMEMLGRLEPSINSRKVEDIKRRLDVMRNQWKAGDLTETTRKRMYLLAKCLSECSFEEASRLQVSLIVDSSCEVSQWIVGVKHIILEGQAQNIRK